MNGIEIRGDSISEAWLQATAAVYLDGPKFHLLVRIAGSDDPAVRHEVNAVLRKRGNQLVETVANTIFPSGMAATCEDHDVLTARYRRLYPKLREHKPNIFGTYFGRMVAFPGAQGPVDQIREVILKLRRAREAQALTSCYEVAIVSPADDARRRMGFPCLSHLSFHLEERERVHLFAAYRNHYMVERAYGNYVGLRSLQEWVASQAGFEVGELSVFSGHAVISGARKPVRELLKERGAI